MCSLNVSPLNIPGLNLDALIGWPAIVGTGNNQASLLLCRRASWIFVIVTTEVYITLVIGVAVVVDPDAFRERHEQVISEVNLAS